MSTINDDRKVIEDGRKNTLKDVDVSLRDQIPETLLEKLNDKNVGQKTKEMWNHGNANRQDWLDRQEEFLGDWDEFLESTAEGPFEGSSTLHIPMPLIVAKTVHARFYQALVGIDPPFTTKARTEGFIDNTRLVQDLMAYTLKDWTNNYDGIDDALDAWVWDWVTTGCGILKARWEKQFERFVDVVKEPYNQFVTQVDPETGEEVQIPMTKFRETEKLVTKTKFEGPIFEDRRVEDVLIIGGGGDVQKADAVIDNYPMTASELWTLSDSKVFDEECVREVIDGGPDYVMGAAAIGNIKQARAINAGKASLDTNSDLDRYTILEAYLRLDVDGSGINTDVVCWVHNKSGKILRATYLHRINKSGERPFFKIDFHKRPGQDYGVGLIEMLHPLSKEMDAMHNMRIDFGLISTMPFGFYRPTSTLEPETLSLRPGDLIPLDNPQTDIYFPSLGNRTAFGFQEEAALQTLTERLTGINDMNLGVMTGAQGATRTATGARALLGESNSNLDVHLRRLQRGWKRALKYLLHMLQQRLPEGFSFRITGEGGADYWTKVANSDQIAGDFDFEISPNSSNSNKQIQEETAMNIIQMIQNPILIQIGVVSSANIYEAYKNYMKVKGVKDFAKYITAPPDYTYLPTPQEEVDRILRGVDVPVVPQADHQGFISYVQTIFNEDHLLGQFDEQAAKALHVQMLKHQQMMEAVQAMQAQQANMQAQQQNAVTSANQAPVGQSAMAGTGAPGGGQGTPQ